MATQGRIGVAVQGAGNVATEHLKAYIANPHCAVVAIGGSTKEKAAAKARQVGLDPDTIGIYDDYDALLAHPGLDALSICTPHARHAQETITAANAGKHVLIEKPVALTLADLRAMDAAVTTAGVRSVVGFVLRWNPLVTTAKALLDDGAFGQPLYIQTDYWHNGEQGGYPGAKGRLGKGTVSAMLYGMQLALRGIPARVIGGVGRHWARLFLASGRAGEYRATCPRCGSATLPSCCSCSSTQT